MKKITISLLILFLLTACNRKEENTLKDNEVEDKHSLKGERKKLYNLITQYRKINNLPKIPISKSLNFVAQTHAKDLENNRPDNGNCNLHSWSAKGKWTPVCYTSDHKQAQKMWSKPKELTSYKGEGYEISCKSYKKIDAKSSLNIWKKSSAHNDVILNKNIWNSKWNAIGIGIYGKYAVVWFGNKKDVS